MTATQKNCDVFAFDLVSIPTEPECEGVIAMMIRQIQSPAGTTNKVSLFSERLVNNSKISWIAPPAKTGTNCRLLVSGTFPPLLSLLIGNIWTAPSSRTRTAKFSATKPRSGSSARTHRNLGWHHVSHPTEGKRTIKAVRGHERVLPDQIAGDVCVNLMRLRHQNRDFSQTPSIPCPLSGVRSVALLRKANYRDS